MIASPFYRHPGILRFEQRFSACPIPLHRSREASRGKSKRLPFPRRTRSPELRGRGMVERAAALVDKDVLPCVPVRRWVCYAAISPAELDHASSRGLRQAQLDRLISTPTSGPLQRSRPYRASLPVEEPVEPGSIVVRPVHVAAAIVAPHLGSVRVGGGLTPRVSGSGGATHWPVQLVQWTGVRLTRTRGGRACDRHTTACRGRDSGAKPIASAPGAAAQARGHGTLEDLGGGLDEDARGARREASSAT